MSGEKTDLFCPNCGQAFTVFLKEMADHNAKAICPSCGKPVDVQPPNVGKPIGTEQSVKRNQP